MKRIYIILTHTGTVLSKIVKAYTKKPFSHVSIALDADLEQMYSFGRLRPSNPFWAGFVHEYKDKGTFKKFINTKAKVYCLEVKDEQYEIMKKVIKHFKENRERYKFNIIGLFAVSINMKIKIKNYMYCAEFVKYMLDSAKVENDLPEIIKPEDFEKLEGIKEVYSGYLREYRARDRLSMAN